MMSGPADLLSKKIETHEREEEMNQKQNGKRLRAIEEQTQMSEEVVVLKTFNNEIEAGMAQQVLHEAGMTTFVFKDDAGGMEPQLQLTNGVRLVVSRADAQRARRMLRT